MKRLKKWAASIPWKRAGLVLAIAAPVAMLAVQLSYPANRTVLFAKVDGVEVGGVDKAEAINQVVAAQKSAQFDVFFGEASEPYRSPKLADLGAKVEAEAAVGSAAYAWWLRLVPTSLWWAHAVVGGESSGVSLDAEAVRAYTTEEMGESCEVDPKNASIKAGSDSLELVPSVDGGSCEVDDVVRLILAAKVGLNRPNQARVPLEKVAPDVLDNQAMKLIETIEDRLKGGIELSFENHSITLSASEIRSWLDFETKDKEIIVSTSSDRAKDTLNREFQSRIAITPNVVTVTTKDFQEISRTEGKVGRAFDLAGTTATITNYLTDKSDQAEVVVRALQPQVRYERSYSATNTGLSALIQHYAQDQKGVYGVSLIELSGQRRRAGYNENLNFFPASTYKVFTAYSVLRQVESGKMSWSDEIVGGRSLEQCFDDMIVRSDNACPEQLTLDIGISTLNADLANLGLGNSRFVGPGRHRSTAADLSNFMANLQAGLLPISEDGRNRLLSALRRNIFRQGIPAGTSGSVANKVGFIDGLLHDTAIVSVGGDTYVLTIMTDGSSWARIAELTREIEKLRAL